MGWRNVIEKMLQNATVAEWCQKYGRHKIYAKGQDFPMAPFLNPITSRIEGQPLKLRVIS